MSTFQQITIIGHIGNKPELINFENGCIVNLSLATTDTYTDKSTGQKVNVTEWHRCKAFGKAAENIVKYTDKGHKLLVTGKLKTRKYTGQDQIERSVTEVYIDSFTFMQPKPEGQPQQNYQPQQNNTQSYNPNFDPNFHAQQKELKEGDIVSADDLPF